MLVRNSYGRFVAAAVLPLATALVTLMSASAVAQHSDIEFKYSSGKIDVEFGAEGQVFEADFPTTGASEQFTTDPGFGSEVDEGAGITPEDIIDYNILGPLKFHNGTAFAPVSSGVQILIEDTPNGSLTVTDSLSTPTTGPGFIGLAGVDEGDGLGTLHSHVDFTLQPGEFDLNDNPPVGAYGLLMSLSSFESDGVTPTGIADSDPFYIVFNFGLAEGEGGTFETAVGAFAAEVPEPSSTLLAVMGMLGIAMATIRRRRRLNT